MRLRRLPPLFAATALLAPAAPATAQEPTPLIVVEIATVRAEPDAATVGAEIARTAGSAAGARRRVERRVATVLRKLDALGVERADVRTDAVNSYRTRRKGRVRHIALTSLQVRTTELEKLGRILRAFGDASISGPEFEVTDATAARQDATRIALQRSRRRADAAAAALGLRVVAIRQVDLNAEFDHDPSFQDMSGGGTDDSGEGGGGPAVEPGRERVSVAVAVVYELAP